MSGARGSLLVGCSVPVLLFLAAGCGGGSGAGSDAGSDAPGRDADAVVVPDVPGDDVAIADDAVADTGADTGADTVADTVADADAAPLDPGPTDADADLPDDVPPEFDAGPCPDGCFIDGVCRANGEINPDNPCQECAAPVWNWAPRSGQACSDGVFCNGMEWCDGSTCRSVGPACDPATTQCLEAEARCCTAGMAVATACNAQGDVQFVDDCGNDVPGQGVPCAKPNGRGGCWEGACGCQEGWTGAGCDRCVRYAKAVGGSDTNAGDTWAGAFATIQPAIDAAAGDACEVWVAAGTYTPTFGGDRSVSIHVKAGVDLYGGFLGTEHDRARHDVTKAVTTLSGDIGLPDDASDNSYHVVTAENGIVDGFTITGGNADGAIPDPSSMGGGLIAVGNSPILRNLVFTANSARIGGGLYVQGDPTVANCRFSANTAQYGAGYYAAGGVHIANSVFVDNPGTALLITDAGEVVNCTFAGNSGAAIALSNPPGPVVRNSILWDNGASIQNGLVGADARFNLIDGGYPGVGNMSRDPLFLSRANGDYRLDQGSPAIDWGRSDALPADRVDLDDDGVVSEVLPTDASGQERVLGKRVDLGAYESGWAAEADPVSCLAIRDTPQNRGNGVYWIDWDGLGQADPVPVFCDMMSDGGGWTRVVNIRGTSAAHVGHEEAVGDVSIDTEAAKLSDAAINGLTAGGYWRYNCSTGVNAFVKNDEKVWTSLASNPQTWWFDAGRDGTYECAASRPGFVFSNYDACPDGHTNYGSPDFGNMGCYWDWAGDWNQNGALWAR